MTLNMQPEPNPLLLQPFLAFLQQAAIARQNNQPEAHAIWLQAASHLFGTADDKINALVLTLVRQGRHADAVALSHAMSWLYPDSAHVQFRFGYALQMADRHAEAVEPYRRALEIAPDLPQLRNNLAIALRLSGGNPAEELALLEAAVNANASECEPWVNLAMAYCNRMDLERALSAGARAVELAPENPQALNNYAQVLQEAQQWDDAQRHAQAACHQEPAHAAYRLNLARLQLLRGNYAEGWLGYEARWDGAVERRHLRRPAFLCPSWQGESLSGKTLLVWGEPGLGELLQGSRFIAQLGERVRQDGGRLIWKSVAQMGGLLARSLGQYVDAYRVDSHGDAMLRADYEIALWSVPQLLGITPDTLPRPPYLQADPTVREVWRARLAGETRLKVGLAWTGSASHPRHAFRRVGVERYATALAGSEGVAFYSLQPGAAADVASARKLGLDIKDYTDYWANFDDTAAFVASLDLVITVCTSVAHLSGALGQRTWVLLDVNPHWSWQLARRDSLWYPSARLYRQRKFAHWGPALTEVAGDLMTLAHQAR
ncbi:tetratricopeptide repeat protein [Burkholderia pyrrocinia]